MSGLKSGRSFDSAGPPSTLRCRKRRHHRHGSGTWRRDRCNPAGRDACNRCGPHASAQVRGPEGADAACNSACRTAGATAHRMYADRRIRAATRHAESGTRRAGPQIPGPHKTSAARGPRPGGCRAQEATDQRAPFRRVAATSRMRRASSRVSGSVSCEAAEGASTRAATLRVIRPHRTATLSARDGIRWTFRTVPRQGPHPVRCGARANCPQPLQLGAHQARFPA